MTTEKRYGQLQLTGPEWMAKNDQLCNDQLAGTLTITIPETFLRIESDYGVFIEIQPACLLNDPPKGFVVRDSHYGSALKILCPKSLKAGDTIQITSKARSGKSYHAKIVPQSLNEAAVKPA